SSEPAERKANGQRAGQPERRADAYKAGFETGLSDNLLAEALNACTFQWSESQTPLFPEEHWRMRASSVAGLFALVRGKVDDGCPECGWKRPSVAQHQNQNA